MAQTQLRPAGQHTPGPSWRSGASTRPPPREANADAQTAAEGTGTTTPPPMQIRRAASPDGCLAVQRGHETDSDQEDSHA